jgi:DNA polymerase zeta
MSRFWTKDRFRLDVEYYISRTLIPPLERIFNLVGANVRSWYEEMPKVRARIQIEQLKNRDLSRGKNDPTLHTFVWTRVCPVCEEMTKTDGQEVCHACRNDPIGSVYSVTARSRTSEARHIQLQAICSDCCGIPFGDEVGCDSRDCPVFYSRLKATSALRDMLSMETRVLGEFENG